METITTTEMHTGGEPLRIIESGYPEIPGDTILEKRRYVRDNLDDLRKMLMFEPRGHKDMYGALLLPGTNGSDFDVLFLHNEGYSTMCGHATIALTRYAVDKKLVADCNSTEVEVKIGCPCGQVVAFYNKDDKSTRFISVPSFVVCTDKELDIEGIGTVKIDLAYGGAYYVIVPAENFGRNLSQMTYSEVVDMATKIKKAAQTSIDIPRYQSEDLAFIYGVIVTDGKDEYSESPTENLVVFADREVDRCPTGSGVTARIALQVHKGQITVGQTRHFINVFSRSEFTGSPVSNSDGMVRVEVKGHGYYTGTAVFTREKDDPLGGGFLMD